MVGGVCPVLRGSIQAIADDQRVVEDHKHHRNIQRAHDAEGSAFPEDSADGESKQEFDRQHCLGAKRKSYSPKEWIEFRRPQRQGKRREQGIGPIDSHPRKQHHAPLLPLKVYHKNRRKPHTITFPSVTNCHINPVCAPECRQPLRSVLSTAPCYTVVAMTRVIINTKHLLSVADLAPNEIKGLVERACDLKGGSVATKSLQGKTVALLFEKPSLRTRVSFEVATSNLGGNCIYLSPQEVGIGGREAVSDVAQVLSRYVDCIVYRCFEHKNLEELAQYATVPVINALSNDEHPCQTLADLTTMLEKRGSLPGTVLAYIGDGNNVARSLAFGAASMGMTFRIASPSGYELSTEVLKRAAQIAAANGGQIEFLRDPVTAVEDANVVYTDVWASMGQEGEAGERKEAFIGYQVNPELMEQAAADAIFMHDLPAHYGEEVPPGFLDHPQSVVFDQAENRLHAQQALLEALIG